MEVEQVMQRSCDIKVSNIKTVLNVSGMLLLLVEGGEDVSADVGSYDVAAGHR